MSSIFELRGCFLHAELKSEPISFSSLLTVIGENKISDFQNQEGASHDKGESSTSAIMCTMNKAVFTKEKPLPVVFAPLTAVLANRAVITIPTAPPTP